MNLPRGRKVMKVIFLDIDGVLNSENHVKELKALVEQGKRTEKVFSRWDLPYKGTMLPLKKIIDETGAKIVLSSTWRNIPRRVKQLNSCFKRYGVEIYDKTCRGIYADELEKLGFDLEICHTVYTDPTHRKYTLDRGAEIASWLSEHPEVESFVILDDDVADIDQYYEKQHVWTDFYDWALTFEKAEQAIKILNGK